MSREALLATLGEPAERTALLHGERQCTYAELLTRVQQCLGWLVDQGVKPGER
ncbi:hypothetical protein RHM66_23100 [Pseudomonas sp. RTB3]|nr:hypothetical protein RHM66_23100 [Pseudomonas sp. RTB3]